MFPDVDFFGALAATSTNLEKCTDPVAPDSLISLFQIDSSKQFDVCEFITTLVNRILEVSNNESIASLFYLRFAGHDHPNNALFCTIQVYPNSSLANAIAHVRDSFGEGFTSLPQLLLIQIGRMIFDNTRVLLEKDTRPMEINDKLKIGTQTYQLYCVIEHLGRTNHGHYIAYVRDAEGWLKCNDSRVTRSSLADVQRSAVLEESPAYVVAYVKDIRDIRVIRRAPAPSHSEKDVGNLHIRLFDACTMKIEESMNIQVSTFDDAILTVNDVKAGWRQKYGDLRVRYRKKRGTLVPQFPRNISNWQEEDVLVWIERANMAEFEPSHVKAKKVAVTYKVERPTIDVSMSFYASTKAKRLITYGKRFFSTITFGMTTGIDVRFFLDLDSRLVLVEQDSFEGMTVANCQAKHGNLTVVVSPQNVVPARALRMKASVYETRNELKEAGTLNFLVSYNITIADALQRAKNIIKVTSCAIYNVNEDGRMARIHYESDYDLLYPIIPENGSLRIEETPEPSSFNFILVDDQDNYVGITFMLALEADESIEELERRVQRYLDVPPIRIRFKPDGGKAFRPSIPYNEVPERVPFVVLVSACEE